MACEYREFADDKIVEIVVDGKVTEADLHRITEGMERFIEAHGRIKILEIIHSFSGVELSILGKGIQFDMKHMKDFSHCAVVTDSGWIGPFTRMLAPFFSIEIRTFRLDEKEKALIWLKQAQTKVA
ncbi:MAG: STAS/SEC14 domain-containing protein [Alphaproteobacteria bacterium]